MTPIQTPTAARELLKRIRCRWKGHRWHRSGILTDNFYRCSWIVTCSRCGVDRAAIEKARADG